MELQVELDDLLANKEVKIGFRNQTLLNRVEQTFTTEGFVNGSDVIKVQG